MKIIIENVAFTYDEGCRLLKLKHNENCPFDELKDIWNDIIPFTFKDIAKFENLEQRRVGIMCLGIDRLVKEVNPTLLNSKTLSKTTSWVNESGELVTKKFKDTYELYEVNGEYFSKGLSNSWDKINDCYFVKCKDTSTDREYLIWVDLQSVYQTNNESDRWGFNKNKVNAIQCVAWTIQTDIAEGNIEKIIRQGDCILIKPKDILKSGKVTTRHLTEKEYKTLLVAES